MTTRPASGMVSAANVHRGRKLLALVALCALPALAEPPKPRVMVILDTSRSMTEKPTFATPLDSQCPPPGYPGYPGGCIPSLPNDVATLSTPGHRGDYIPPPGLNNQCDNKFCAAKSVIYNVLPNFVDDARIGITTYFQYSMKATTPDTRTTTCAYDVLAPPGQSRTFTSLYDYSLGGAADVCPGATPWGSCTATAAAYLPDSPSGSGSNLLRGFCKVPTTYTTPPDPMNRPAACVGLNCYKFVKRAATPQVAVSCMVNSYAAGTPFTPTAFPATIAPVTTTTAATSASWCTAASYNTMTAKTLIPAAGQYYEKVVASTTAVCPGVVEPQSLTPNTANGTPNASMTTGTTTGKWLTAPNTPAGLKCSSGFPCTMFLGVAAPKLYATYRDWYVFFGNPSLAAFTLPAGYGNPPTAYTYSARTGQSAYTPSLLSGTINVAGTTTCLAAPGAPIASSGAGSTGSVGRYTTGSLGSFGISGATLGALLPAPSTPVTNETPGRNTSTNDYACANGLAGALGAPCDVAVTNDVPVVGAWSNAGVVYTPGANTATANFCNAATASTCKTGAPGINSINYTLRVIGAGGCPPIGTVTSNPTPVGTVWTSAPTGCAATATATCQFSAPTSSTPTMPVGTCNPKTLYSSTAVPGTCAFNGKSYVASGGPTSGTMTTTVTGSATCPASSTIGAAGVYSGTGCGGYPCDLTATGSSVGTPVLSAWGTFNAATPPSGYVGAPINQRNYGGPTWQSALGVADSTYNDCAAATNSTTTVSGSMCPGSGTCTVKVLGMAVVGTSCTSELGKSCYTCQYQPLEFQWSKPSTVCNYSTSGQQYTVDQTYTQCVYNRPQWQYETKAADTHNCTYSVGATRVDFTQELRRTCQYWGVQSTMQAPRTLYTYEYQTKGDEPIGRASLTTPPGNAFCSDAYGGAFAATCPAVVPNCTSLSGAGFSIPANSNCKLRWGGGSGNASNAYDLASGNVNSNTGRYFGFDLSAGSPVALPGAGATRSCEEVLTAVTLKDATAANSTSVAIPASADSYKNDAATPTGFCSSAGVGSTSTYKLVSDWYDPGQVNDIGPFLAAYPGATVTWNNTATKAQGFGGVATPSILGPGTVPVRATLVPIPNDVSYDPAAQRLAIQKVAGPCIPPSVTPPNPDGTLAGGACLTDQTDPHHPLGSVADVTPLYGSLKNTYDYLYDRWLNDDDAQACRGYYIILATDGAENTPRNFQLTGTDPGTSVEGLVGSFRSASISTSPDVKTFVIGFGEGAAGSGGLNAVASAGGTNAAFSASSQSELATALRTVFTTITQGTYSRSKPALGTDGTRLYAAQYVEPSTGPDWSGLLTAYRVTASGDPMPVWEFGRKLDAQASRTIKVALLSSGIIHVGSFDSANATLVDQLDDCGTSCAVPFPLTMTATDIINFLKEKGHAYHGSSATRESAAGPIVSSSPVVIGKSPFDIAYGGSTPADRDEFRLFGQATESRGTRVMFQSNDGQTHSVYDNSTNSICASLGESDPGCPNGTEAWALVPGMLSGRQSGSFGRPMLSQSLYNMYAGGWANMLLDGILSVADVCERSGNAAGCQSSDWKTIAIGTQRAGGRGVYALDITAGSVPTASHVLWNFADGDLGLTYSVPAVGRVVEDHGREAFVAVFGAGVDDPNTGSFEGSHVFVLNALSGTPIKEYHDIWRGLFHYGIPREVVNRPAIWRRPGSPFMDSAYLGIDSSLYAMRFAKSSGDQWGDSDHWEPDELFDPASSRNEELATNLTVSTTVNVVTTTSSGSATVLPTYALQSIGTLPISGPAWWGTTPPPIFNRPKLSSQLLSSGAVPDLYVGTGDTRDPENPSFEFRNGNFFYAVHDFNRQPHGNRNDGRALWVVNFPHKEQVVSEPAILSGCIVVATYTPPAFGSRCGVAGDTTLYGFDPLTGSLVQCLYYPSMTGIPAGWVGQATSVVHMQGVGIPSDLVVVNDNVYVQTSNGGLLKAPARQIPQPGAVRSYRRIK